MNNRTLNDLISYRLTKAKETLNEIDDLVPLKFYNTAVNRIYYACYYAVCALLLKHHLNTKTHSGVRQMLGLHFIQKEKIPKESGKFYTDLFDKRHQGDYSDYVEYDKQTVVELIKPAKEFIKSIEKLI